MGDGPMGWDPWRRIVGWDCRPGRRACWQSGFGLGGREMPGCPLPMCQEDDPWEDVGDERGFVRMARGRGGGGRFALEEAGMTSSLSRSLSMAAMADPLLKFREPLSNVA